MYLKRETPATPPKELIVYLLSINGPNQRWFKIGPKKGPKTGKKKNGPKMVQKWSKNGPKNSPIVQGSNGPVVQ